ncbi:MAG: MATE family efflux transporter [Pseudomonadota bacterium]
MANPTGNDLTKGNVMRHVTVMSFTSSIGIMAIYLVDLFDIFFISLLGHEEVAAAAGYATTLLFFISALNIGLSIGAGALIARELGARRISQARDYTAASSSIAFCVGIVLPVVTIPFMPFFVGLLGATGNVAEMAVNYLYIVVPASGLSAMSMVYVAAIRADGDAKWAMYPALLGAVINLVFDPILIFGLGLDLQGAAIATVLARVGTFALAWHAVSRRFDLMTAPRWDAQRKLTKEIMDYAWPALLANVATPVGTAIITRYVTFYGPEAVAGFAVVGRLTPVVFSVVNALSESIGAIIGQNYGAKRFDRVRRAYYAAMTFLAVYVAIAIGLLILFENQIATAFSAEGLARDIIGIFCGLFSVVAFFNGALFVSTAAFNNLGYPTISPWVSWAKNTVGLVPIVWIGIHYFGFIGIFYGLLANSALFAVFSYVIAEWIMGHLPPEAKQPKRAAFPQRNRHIAVSHSKPMHS